MSREQNETAARRFFEGFSTGKLDTAQDYIAPGFKGHGPGTPPNTTGIEGYRSLAGMYRTAFPDLHIRVEEVIGEGDTVAACWTATGTHRGDLMGIPPTGKHATATGMHLFHLSSGKITDARVEYDMLGMLQQLGVVPAPGQARRAA